MKLSSNHLKILIDEMEFVIDKINSTTNYHEQLFYFSAIFGMISRILNLEFKSDLVHIHLILRTTYESLLQRMRATEKGDKTVPLFEEQFNSLLSLTIELNNNIKNGRSLNDTLEKFAVLTFSTTGNGYYLYRKGLLKI